MRHAELARSLAHDTDQGWLSAFTGAITALPLIERGDWDAAAAAVADAQAGAAANGDPASILYATATAGRLALRRGRPTSWRC